MGTPLSMLIIETNELRRNKRSGVAYFCSWCAALKPSTLSLSGVGHDVETALRSPPREVRRADSDLELLRHSDVNFIPSPDGATCQRLLVFFF